MEKRQLPRKQHLQNHLPLVLRAAQQPAPEDSKGKESEEEGGEEKEDKGSLTVAFGRFNPPTVGHQKLLDAAGGQA